MLNMYIIQDILGKDIAIYDEINKIICFRFG